MARATSTDILKRLNGSAELNALFPPNKAVTTECVYNDTPTIFEFKNAIGGTKVHKWLVLQIAYVNEMVGPDKKMELPQMVALADLLEEQLGIFTFEELLLFFKWVRAGKYGKFYGNVDAQVFTCAVPRFNDEIIELRTQAELKRSSEQRAREQEESRRNAISREEYLKLLERAKNGDEEAKRLLRI